MEVTNQFRPALQSAKAFPCPPVSAVEPETRSPAVPDRTWGARRICFIKVIGAACRPYRGCICICFGCTCGRTCSVAVAVAVAVVVVVAVLVDVVVVSYSPSAYGKIPLKRVTSATRLMASM